MSLSIWTLSVWISVCRLRFSGPNTKLVSLFRGKLGTSVVSEEFSSLIAFFLRESVFWLR